MSLPDTQPKPIRNSENDNNILVSGIPFTNLPQDLYIPPNALCVFLETFSGPLDLLLYLIRKQNLNILDIPISKITAQYMEYIEIMRNVNLELAAEYLVMAAILTEIKSRLLLPKVQTENSEEVDPRTELIRKLQEYEKYKILSEQLDQLPRLERDYFLINANAQTLKTNIPTILPSVELNDLIKAFQAILARCKLSEHHKIQRDILSVRERMSQILTLIQKEKFTNFNNLFKTDEGRIGIVVTFIAILELLKQSAIELVQTELFGNIHIKKIMSSEL